MKDATRRPALPLEPTQRRRTEGAGMATTATESGIAILQSRLNASPTAQRLAALQRVANGTSPAPATIQRAADEEEPLQGKAIQTVKDEEDPLQGKAIQNVEDEEDPLQGKMIQRETMEDEEAVQGKAIQRVETGAGNAAGGLPNPLRAGIESLSGLSMDGVQVHRNSAAPAQVGAHAYAQGRDIHLGPGQERHLPHEAWHVVQQAQGRVRPTLQAKGVAINDDAGLEREADVMGAKALQLMAKPDQTTGDLQLANLRDGTVQRAGTKPNQPSEDGRYRIKLSSAREEFSYENRVELGLDAVLPRHYPLYSYISNNGMVTKVRRASDMQIIPLANPIPVPSGSKRLLMIDTVGFDDPIEEDRANPLDFIHMQNVMQDPIPEKLFIDIKIGTYTKSGQQFREESAGWLMRGIKNIEHNLKDMSRESRTLGYDIDKGNLAAFMKVYEAAADNYHVAKGLKAAMGEILEPLYRIEMIMRNAPVTFVGSSVFIVLNMKEPVASDVKLIDPDHPIVLEDLDQGTNIPGDVMTSGKMQGRNWNEYKQKWMTSFATGMTNFYNWFEAKRNSL